ncbi:MAG: hypothetical protein ABFD96_13995 [Armatimonadia bacterium]
MAPSSGKIVVLGMMGRCPFGGQTWLYLNWLRGLQHLGFDVWYVEDDTVWPFDPERNEITDDCAYAVRHIADCMARIGLDGKWAFRLADRTGACWGLTADELNDLYRSCDALLNIVGATDLRDEHMAAPLRAYVETDPVTAELRLANGDEHTRLAFAAHDLIFTYGENYGAPDCGVPLNGLESLYRPTRQPIDLDLWPSAYDENCKAFTTIGNYRQNGADVEYAGETYHWSKHHEWERFMALPALTSQPFHVAMRVDEPDDLRQLEANGWSLASPVAMSLDIFGAYPAFIRNSRAEWTVAKDQNIRLRSGWFSERDVCYLASGKPVIAQDTGFGNILPTGEGLFSFSTMDEVLAAVDAINSDYRRHCQAARALAQEYFDCRKIAAKLVTELGLN